MLMPALRLQAWMLPRHIFASQPSHSKTEPSRPVTISRRYPTVQRAVHTGVHQPLLTNKTDFNISLPH